MVEVEAEKVVEEAEGSGTILGRVGWGLEGDVAAVVVPIEVDEGLVGKAVVVKEEAEGGRNGGCGKVGEHVRHVEGVIGDGDVGGGLELVVNGSDVGGEGVGGRKGP